MTTETTPARHIGRPALRRYRADVAIVIELGAVDEADADARLEALVAELLPRFATAVRNAGGRRGNPRLIGDATTILDASEV